MKDKMLRISISTLLVLMIFPYNGNCQKSFLRAGFGLTESVGKAFPAKFGPGTELACVMKASSGFYLGLGLDYYSCEEFGRSIHVPGNLTSDEHVFNRLNTFAAGAMAYLDLSPRSRTKFFVGGRLALRHVTSKMMHDGYTLLVLATENTLYEKKTLGPAGEVFISLFMPLTKKAISPIGLELKCGIVTGGKISYVNSNGVYYNSSMDKIMIPAPREATLSSINSSIAFVWNFN